MLQVIPYDVMVHILGYLRPVERSKICHLSSQWRDITIAASISWSQQRCQQLRALGIIESDISGEVSAAYSAERPTSTAISRDLLSLIMSDYHLYARLGVDDKHVHCVDIIKHMFVMCVAHYTRYYNKITAKYAFIDDAHTEILNYFINHINMWESYQIYTAAKYNNIQLLDTYHLDDRGIESAFAGALHGGWIDLVKKYATHKITGSVHAGNGGNIECIKFCAEYESSIDGRSADSLELALHGACEKGQIDAIKWLVQQGHEPAHDHIYSAISGNNVNGVKYLVETYKPTMAALDNILYGIIDVSEESVQRDIMEYIDSLRSAPLRGGTQSVPNAN